MLRAQPLEKNYKNELLRCNIAVVPDMLSTHEYLNSINGGVSSLPHIYHIIIYIGLYRAVILFFVCSLRFQ